MNKFFLSFLTFGILFSANMFAQKPNISYPSPQTHYVSKPITPIKVTNTGGAVINRLYPQITNILKTECEIQEFIRFPSGDIGGILYSSVVHIKPNGSYSFLAGGQGSGYVDATGTAAKFGELRGIAKDAAGNIYVTDLNYRDPGNSRVRKITQAGVVTTYANGLRGPGGIAIDAAGMVYVAEGAGRIVKIANDGSVSVLAGKYGNGSNDGTGAEASFNGPQGLTIDKDGNLYVADSGNNLIRKVTPTGVVTTVAGSKKMNTIDGTGTAASFSNPTIVKVDSKGNLIVFESDDVFRKITSDAEVTTITKPYYNDKGVPVGQSFINAAVFDDNDDIIIYSYTGNNGRGFYKMLTTGYSVTPALPAGLVFSPDGTISGTPANIAFRGIYKFTATNSSGSSSAIVSLEVGVSADPPIISSFSPASSFPAGMITINGMFFTETTAVTIGGKPAAEFYVESPTKITAYVAEEAVSGEITVTNDYGTARLSGFNIIPPPTITSISPSSGWTGSKIIITGTGFSTVNYVAFEGYYGTFKIISPTQIEAIVTNGASGNVQVFSPSGEASFAGFTFIKSPAVSSISPSNGGAGSTITINGSNFTNATSVKFGQVEASSFTVVSPTQITAVVAPGSSNGITVSTPAGTTGYSYFNFVPPPVVSLVSPLKGGYNSSFYINGSGLEGAKITIGGVPAIITYNSGYQIYANVGTGSVSGDVKITTNGGTTTYPGYIVVEPPQITSFSPATAALGDKVTITGINLSEVDMVAFGGVNAAFTVLSPTTIEATVEYGGSGWVEVRSEGGSAILPGFTHKGPAITSFSPANAGNGETVIIKGANFTGTTGVAFGGVPASSFIVISATEISAVVGNGRSGSISVTTPSGKAFSYGFNHPGPAISIFTPSYAGPLLIAPVTITGNNFTGTTAVSFGGVPAASFTVISATSIIATPSVSVSGNVVVTTPQGTDSRPGFTWVQVPTVSSISPSSQNNGGMVTITGTNFTGVTDVKFGGVRASYFYVSSPTSIIAYVGPGASGDVEVSTVGGTGIISGFKYTNPFIETINPALGAPGQLITITGTNLENVQSVKFGGVNAASFSIISPEKITAVIGLGATGNVTVNSPTGSASIQGFTFINQPYIYSCTPTSGGKGTIITIYGSNLLGTSEVKLGGVKANILSIESNRVTVEAGTGATGKISLTNPAGVTEYDGFTWYPAPTITSASPMAANAETMVTINGTNFTGVTQVKFGESYTNFTLVSPTKITAQPLYGSSGDITISSPGGTVTLPGFEFIPAPIISSFEKINDGPDATVTITGVNFTNVTEVKFGDVKAKSFTVVSTTIITAQPGDGASGLISVKAAGGVGTIRGYLYNNPPAILSFTPVSAPIGSTVVINGDNFNLAPEKNIVYAGIVKAYVKSASKTSLEIIVPGGGSGQLTVTNTDNHLSAISNLQFMVTNTTGKVSFSNKTDVVYSNTSKYDLNDFDGDGKADILIITPNSSSILIYGNDPALSGSSFSKKIELISGRQILSWVVGDVDGDGKKDILFSIVPSVIVLRNTSTGNNISFEQKTLEDLDGSYDYMALRDIDMDGRPDLIMDAGASIYYPNRSTQTAINFGPYMYLATSGGGSSIAVTDIDGDNKPDVIKGTSYQNVALFKNQSVPGDLLSEDFPLVSLYHPNNNFNSQYLITADFDGDNKIDLFEGNTWLNYSLISRNTSVDGAVDQSSFGATARLNTGALLPMLRAVDMDGDGKIDLLAPSNKSVNYWRNQSTPGSISLAAPTSIISNIANDNPSATIARDVDGDGRVDLVLSDLKNNKIVILHNGPAVAAEITSANPLIGYEGTLVTITGKHFDGTSVVNFGTKPAKSYTVISHDTIVAVVGEGESGDISVNTPNGAASISGFVYAKVPVISVAAALTDGSGTLNIKGNNFMQITSVAIAGVPALSFTVNSDTTITAIFNGISGELTVTNSVGNGAFAGVTVKVNSIINFPVLPVHTYGDSDFDLAVSSNNANMPITYSVSKPGIINITNSKVHIIAAGTVTITASQAGDILNNAANDTKQVLVISKKDLQITADDKTRYFGMQNPELTLTYNGFVNNDNESAIHIAPKGSTVANRQSPAGNYDITVKGGSDGNYSFTYFSGNLTVRHAITNFKIATNSVTCKGENNGLVNIVAAESAEYTAVINGNGINKSVNFNVSANINDLAAGVYNLCITNIALNDYQQCFDLVVTEPEDLSAYTMVNTKAGTVNIALAGAQNYNINLNGTVYKTSSSSITLALQSAKNTLSISTDKPCQGIIKRIINFLDNTTPYPNPFNNILNIDVGEYTVEKVSVKIYSLNNGTLKLFKNFDHQSGVISIDASGLSYGAYALHLIINDKLFVYKIIK